MLINIELFSDHFFVLLGDFNAYTGTSTEVEDIQVDLGSLCLSGMESMESISLSSVSDLLRHTKTFQLSKA